MQLPIYALGAYLPLKLIKTVTATSKTVKTTLKQFQLLQNSFNHFKTVTTTSNTVKTTSKQ